MANNYWQSTVRPSLPRNAFVEGELQRLNLFGLSHEDAGEDRLYLFAEEGISEEPRDYYDSEEQPPACDQQDYRDSYDILRDVLRRLPEDEVPEILIEGAYTCSSLRPGEFGGTCARITRKSIRLGSTEMLLEMFRKDEALIPAFWRVLELAKGNMLDESACDKEEALLEERKQQEASVETIRAWLIAHPLQPASVGAAS